MIRRARIKKVFAAIILIVLNVLFWTFVRSLFPDDFTDDYVNYLLLGSVQNINEQLAVDNTSDMDIVSAIGIVVITSPFLIAGLLQLRKIFKEQKIDRKEDLSMKKILV